MGVDNTGCHISFSTFTGSITGGHLAGGFVGQIGHSGRIMNCISEGEMDVLWSSGGFVGGYLTAHIQDCYATTTLTSLGNFGGIVGLRINIGG